MSQITHDATLAGAAAIDRLGSPPCEKGLCNHFGVKKPSFVRTLQQGIAQRQTHGRVVRDLPRLEVEPAAADDMLVNAVVLAKLMRDFARRHEFHGGAQGIADGEPQVSAQDAVVEFSGGIREVCQGP